MTLEEAIAHCEEKAMCNNDCGLEHKQLADWLIELKNLRKQMSDAVEAHVNAFNDNGKRVAELSTDIPVERFGDKVRIIILKQEAEK